jgi:hypothetical protein
MNLRHLIPTAALLVLLGCGNSKPPTPLPTEAQGAATPNQTLTTIDNGYYTLQNACTNQYADVDAYSTSDGSPLHQWVSNANGGGINQRFHLQRVTDFSYGHLG